MNKEPNENKKGFDSENGSPNDSHFVNGITIMGGGCLF